MNYWHIQKFILLFLTFLNIYFPTAKSRPFLTRKIYKNNSTNSSQENKYLKSLIIDDTTNFLTSVQNFNNVDSQIDNLDVSSNKLVNELIIESKVQSEKDNVLNAYGEVIVKYKGNILKADSLLFNKKTKFAKAQGNIQLIVNNQIFQAEEVEYDFIKKKGYFKNVKGLINFESIISDFDLNSNSIYENLLLNIPDIKKEKIIFTPDKVINWIFSTEYLNIDNNKWSSDKAFLTNDLLNTNQIKLQFNEFKVYPSKEKLKFKSKINYLILNDKITIPFWFGDRTIFKDSNNNNNNFVFQNRWNISYDKLNKDGYFIGRKLNSIKIKNDLFFNLEPQFLFQRALKGSTKSFVQKNYSINSPRVERNISLSDYFALKSSLEGKIKDWDLKINNELNSFDLGKFANAFSARAELSKEIDLFNGIFVNRIFGAYRERIWNGSIGESEVYTAYGWKLDQINSWKNGSVEKNQIITFGFGNYKAEELNTSNFAQSYKGSISYQLDQKIPVFKKKINSKYVDKSFEYIPEPIKQGIYINSTLSVNYNFYKDGNSQQYLGFGLGPEIVIGDFKKNLFDFTRLGVSPFYKLTSGNSIFKFDEVSDNFTVDFNFDQQLIGPWLLTSQGTINLDKDSDNFWELIYSKIGINFKKRSYSFGIFYQTHNQAGGINFTLNGFK